jgi:CRISPR/Cas system-associated endonuclease Cas1
MIKNKQIHGSAATFALFSNKLNNILKIVYSQENVSDEEFQNKCLQYINEVDIEHHDNTVGGQEGRAGQVSWRGWDPTCIAEKPVQCVKVGTQKRDRATLDHRVHRYVQEKSPVAGSPFNVASSAPDQRAA